MDTVAAPAPGVSGALARHWAILVQDLRYTSRTLGRARGFALTAVVVTALGVGANTAAFSVADFVLFRPFPFADPEALVRLCEGPRTGGGWGCMNQLSPSNYRDLKGMTSSFQALGAFGGSAVNLVGGGEPRRLSIASLTPEVLPLLGVPPALGRVFASTGHDDDRAVILSHGLWQSQFGGDPGVLGRTVDLNGARYVIIGVMPRTFQFPDRDVHLWTSLAFQPGDFEDRRNRYLQAVGRLAPGVTFEQAHADLLSAASRLARDYPQTNSETGISFYRMRDAMAPRYGMMLTALAGASLCLLLLTCANLGNLLLARSAARAREFAVRAALGAGRARLVRQLITESVVLSVLGGTCGLLIAALGVPLFSGLVPPTLPIDNRPALDLRVLGMAALFTALVGLGFGVLPALGAGGLRGFTALREGSRAGGGRRQRLRAVLVTIEITMSVILLIASGLLIRAVWRVEAIDPGFTTRNVLTLRTALPRPKYDDPVRRARFYDRVLQDVGRLPGVQSAAYITGLPMVMTGGMARIQIPGRDMPRDASNNVSLRFVTPQFFATMGIPVLQGRDVEDGDIGERAWVAVVSESFIARHWPGEDPLGKTFLHLGRPRTIVGVVGNIRVRGLERPSEPQLYLPAAQVAAGNLPFYDPKELVIRHSGEGTSVVPAIRRIVRAADPDQPVSDVRTLDDVLAGDTATRRDQLRVLGALALIALLLSGVGIHGLLAYMVSQRSQEIGVRLALGAGRSSIARMIVANALGLAAIGIVVGVPCAYAAARGMSALLFGVEPGDPAAIGAAAALALLMTVAGSVFPALRAVRVSPMVAMRAE